MKEIIVNVVSKKLITKKSFFYWSTVVECYSRPRGREFEPHGHHCVVSFSKTHLSLLSTGSTQEDPS